MHALLNIAVLAARRAGDLILRHVGRVDQIQVSVKGHNDLVTEVDRAAEREIIRTVHDHYPDHAILAEESGRHGESDHVWIIDPLDGTTNFVHGFPVFSVSVALQVQGRLEHGVIYDPLRQELFTASRGAGAQLDGRRIRVSKQKDFAHGLIGTGFPFRNARWLDEYLAMLGSVLTNTSGIRRPGSAALDLAYVAAGRLDGFWELGLKSWDIAAGALLIREAGGRISDLSGGDRYLDQGHVVAGNPYVYAALSKLLSPNIPADLR